MSQLLRFPGYLKAVLSIAGVGLALGSTSMAASTAGREAVSFRNDVMPVLSKGGCNAGTCHGNKNGKGGFKLSLRGQDPDLDYVALTQELSSRRVDVASPRESLILLK